MRKKICLSLLAAAMMIFTLTACGNDEKMTVGSVIFESTNEWFVEATAGMDDAARKMGVNLAKSDSRYDATVERDLIREQIKNKVGAIVICPLSVDESGAVLSEASQLGIPVVTWNTVVNPAPTSQIVVDSTELGSATGKYLDEYVKENGITKLNAIYVVYDAFSIAKERCDGFRQSVQPLVDNGTLEVATEIKGHLYEETCVAMEKMLNEYPDVNFIWCWNQMTTNAAVDVLKKLGRSDVIIAGTDMSMALANEMIDNKVNLVAITTQQPYEMGYQAVSAAVKAAKGEKVEQNIVIPTLTYTKSNAVALKEYIDTHKKFVK